MINLLENCGIHFLGFRSCDMYGVIDKNHTSYPRSIIIQQKMFLNDDFTTNLISGLQIYIHYVVFLGKNINLSLPWEKTYIVCGLKYFGKL
jgi:hypothetical protein